MLDEIINKRNLKTDVKSMKLEDIQPDASVTGIIPDIAVSVVKIEWHGSDALTMIYRTPDGKVSDQILYRHDEARLKLLEKGRPWEF